MVFLKFNAIFLFILVSLLSCKRHTKTDSALLVNNGFEVGGKLPMFVKEPPEIIMQSTVLFQTPGGSPIEICSGVLVKNNRVLTAKHCLKPNINKVPNVVLFDGSVVQGLQGTLEREKKLDLAFFDLAIPVKKPFKEVHVWEEGYPISVGHKAIIAGYGQIKPNVLSPNKLHFGFVRYTGQWIKEVVSDTNGFVAKDVLLYSPLGLLKEKQGILPGDSGGPTFGKDENGKWGLVGINSISKNTITGIYSYITNTRVKYVKNWFLQ